MSKRKKMNADVAAVSSSEGVSRRGFMKTAALGTGAAATAATVVTEGVKAATDSKGQAIRRSEDLELILSGKVPVPTGEKYTEFPMDGAHVFARACKEEGLGALFCCPGNYQIITALADQGIPTYGGRTEGPMCSAADAFTRVTGVVSATSGTEGPGFTNMICAIAAANASRTPILVVASNMSLSGDDTERGIQRGYQQPTTEGLKKYGKRVVDISRVHEYAGYAFRQLKSGIPGPVHLDFVAEVSARTIEDESDLKYAFDKHKYRTESKPFPDPKDIARAVELIRKAKRPMIVASTGVFYDGACDILKDVAEKAQIPVVESGPMRGKFSDSHPLSANTAETALESADLVVLIGQYCMPTIGEYRFGPDAKYIRIDPRHEDIGRNLPIDVGIVSSEKAALEALHEALPPMKHDAWVAEVAASRKAFAEYNDELYALGMKYSGDDAIHPAVMSQKLADFLYAGDMAPEQTTVVAGGFGIARYMRRWLQAHRPGQICNGAYQYGSIGPDVGYTVGVGAAVQLGAGAQKGYAGTPVVGITGDAGFGYSAMEMETLAKYGIPAIVIVYNNNAWGTWAGGSRNKLVAHVHQFQENLRYEKVGMALGAHGEYVTNPSQFTPALERCWDVAVNEGRPSVINCQAKKEFHNRRDFPPGLLGKAEPGATAYNH